MSFTPQDSQRRRCIDLCSDSSDSSQSKKVKTQGYETDLSSSSSSSSSSEIKSLLQTLGIETKEEENNPTDEDKDNCRRDSAPLKRTKSSKRKDVPIEQPWVLDEARNELYFTSEYKGTSFPEFRIPRHLYQKLFAHQVEGVRWMAGLYHSGGGLLGDDMGMGKTFTTLTCLGGLMNTGTICNALVVAPKSVLRSWEREASKVLLSCVPIACIQVMSADHSPLQRKRILSDALAAARSKSQRPQLVITSYGMVEKSTDLFLGGSKDAWDYVVLDEGHTIKNRRTKTHASCQSICKPKTRRVMLTGTPIMNNLEELWTIFDWISAGRLLGDLPTFKYAYIKPIDAARDKDATATIIQRGDDRSANLQEVLRPFLLQRRKFDILRELLPPKTEIVVWTHLSKQQREIYDIFLQNKRSFLRSLRDGETALVLAAITRMKMLCGHPSLFDESFEKPDLQTTIEQSSKLETMMHLVEKMTEQNHKILIFSQSTKMLDIIERSLVEVLGLSVFRIDGDTKERVRQQLVDDFNDPKSVQNVMLLSTKAGGVGITLTGADRVILFDPSWNPSEDDQAIGRAYRIGQTREVTVFRMITAGTVEEKMYERQLYKDGIRRVVLTTGDEVQRYFQRSELSKMFNLGLPGECQTLEKAQEEGNDCSQSEFNFVRKFKNVLGLSRHDVFYKTSDAVADKGHDGTKLAFSSVPTNVSNPRHILDNVMDAELAEIAMLGGVGNPMSSARKPRDSNLFSLPTSLDNLLRTASRPEFTQPGKSADLNIPKRLAFTPKASTEKKPPIKTPVFQFDDFDLNAPTVPVSKPKEIIDVDSDDDFSLSGGPVFGQSSSVMKTEQEDIKPAATVSSNFQTARLMDFKKDMPAPYVALLTVKDEVLVNSKDDIHGAYQAIRSPDCQIAPSVVKSEAKLDSENDISSDHRGHVDAEGIPSPECLVAPSTVKSEVVLDSEDGMQCDQDSLGACSGEAMVMNDEASRSENIQGMNSTPLNAYDVESSMKAAEDTSVINPSVAVMLQRANHFKEIGQPRRALQQLANILDNHYGKLDEKGEVSLHEQIGRIVFQENPDYLS